MPANGMPGRDIAGSPPPDVVTMPAHRPPARRRAARVLARPRRSEGASRAAGSAQGDGERTLGQLDERGQSPEADRQGGEMGISVGRPEDPGLRRQEEHDGIGTRRERRGGGGRHRYRGDQVAAFGGRSRP